MARCGGSGRGRGADPGEQRRGGRGVRQLAGERERLRRRPGRRSRPRRWRRRGCRARGWPGRAGGGRGRAGRCRRHGRSRRRRRCRRPAGRWRRSPRGSPRRWRAQSAVHVALDVARRAGSTAAPGGGRPRAGVPSPSKTTALVTVRPLSIPSRLGMARAFPERRVPGGAGAAPPVSCQPVTIVRG